MNLRYIPQSRRVGLSGFKNPEEQVAVAHRLIGFRTQGWHLEPKVGIWNPRLALPVSLGPAVEVSMLVRWRADIPWINPPT